jgi:hypothetical protein
MSTNITQHEKFKEITEFFTRFKYFGPIIVKTSVNEVLDEALTHEGRLLHSTVSRAHYKRCRIF